MPKRPKTHKGEREPGAKWGAAPSALTTQNRETLDLSRSQAVRGSRQADSERQETNKSSGEGPRGFGPDATQAEEALALTEGKSRLDRAYSLTSSDPGYFEAIADLTFGELVAYSRAVLGFHSTSDALMPYPSRTQPEMSSHKFSQTEMDARTSHPSSQERGSDVERSDNA